MHLSAVNARVTAWTFRFMLLKRAYSRSSLEQMARESRFGRGEVLSRGIGCELRLSK